MGRRGWLRLRRRNLSGPRYASRLRIDLRVAVGGSQGRSLCARRLRMSGALALFGASTAEVVADSGARQLDAMLVERADEVIEVIPALARAGVVFEHFSNHVVWTQVASWGELVDVLLEIIEHVILDSLHQRTDRDASQAVADAAQAVTELLRGEIAGEWSSCRVAVSDEAAVDCRLRVLLGGGLRGSRDSLLLWLTRTRET